MHIHFDEWNNDRMSRSRRSFYSKVKPLKMACVHFGFQANMRLTSEKTKKSLVLTFYSDRELSALEYFGLGYCTKRGNARIEESICSRIEALLSSLAKLHY